MMAVIISVILCFLSLKKLYEAFVENAKKAFPEEKATPVFINRQKMLWDYRKLSKIQQRLCDSRCHFALVVRKGNCLKFYTSCTIREDNVYYLDEDAITIVSSQWFWFAFKYLRTF